MCFSLHFFEIMVYDCSCLLMVLVVRRAENLLFHSQRFSDSELQGLKYNPAVYEMPVNTHVCVSYLRHGKTAYRALSWNTNIFQTAWEVIKNRLAKVCKIIKNHCTSPVIYTARGKVDCVYNCGYWQQVVIPGTNTIQIPAERMSIYSSSYRRISHDLI